MSLVDQLSPTYEGKISESAERLSAAIRRIQTSDDFKDWLRISAKFWHYSWANQLMIWSQRPEATRVAGFNKWLELKKPVKKGEKGIAIFAPMFKKFISQEDGMPHQQLIGFKVVFVFDVAQTDGPALPEPPRPDPEALDADGVVGLDAQLTALTAARGCTLTRRILPDQMGGSYEPHSKLIT